MTERITIAGAGVMGASIAQTYAQHGYSVTIYDIFPEGLRKGEELIKLNQETSVAVGRLTGDQSRNLLSRISFTGEMDCFKDTDYVIECVFERMDIKHDFWAKASAI
ncbi:MAG: 3-hydroxyacyl-CoA dehydrogenase family protein, partial [Oscillospiraceae bacterium]|nr:3-hydroxyacyl-CoA dehydrogenase family protein [Oscillospiraceae bacterium]